MVIYRQAVEAPYMQAIKQPGDYANPPPFLNLTWTSRQAVNHYTHLFPEFFLHF